MSYPTLSNAREPPENRKSCVLLLTWGEESWEHSHMLFFFLLCVWMVGTKSKSLGYPISHSTHCSHLPLPSWLSKRMRAITCSQSSAGQQREWKTQCKPNFWDFRSYLGLWRGPEGCYTSLATWIWSLQHIQRINTIKLSSEFHILVHIYK